MPDPDPPGGTDGTCDNNGVCDKNTESCQSCPSDCPCCYAYQAFGNSAVKQATNAEGKEDNQFAQMGPLSVVVVAMGKGIQNQVGDDFKLHGTVHRTGAGGSVTVSVKDALPHAQGKWYRLGPWIPAPGGTTASFDVGQVPFSGPSFSEIKLESTAGVTAKLDAVESVNCKK